MEKSGTRKTIENVLVPGCQRRETGVISDDISVRTAKERNV